MPRAQRGPRADELLEQYGLDGRGGDKVDNYSGGMAQRLLIARAMMHEPRVLFLDEPSTGLDPQARLFVWDQVRAMRDRGVTVVLTTHDMAEAAELADRVGIVDHGRLLALGTPGELTRTLEGSATLDVTASVAGHDTTDDVVAALGGLDGVARAEAVGSGTGGDVRVHLVLDREPVSMVAPVGALLAGRGGRLGAVDLGKPSLQDVFIALTGRELR